MHTPTPSSVRNRPQQSKPIAAVASPLTSKQPQIQQTGPGLNMAGYAAKPKPPQIRSPYTPKQVQSTPTMVQNTAGYLLGPKQIQNKSGTPLNTTGYPHAIKQLQAKTAGSLYAPNQMPSEPALTPNRTGSAAKLIQSQGRGSAALSSASPKQVQSGLSAPSNTTSSPVKPKQQWQNKASAALYAAVTKQRQSKQAAASHTAPKVQQQQRTATVTPQTSVPKQMQSKQAVAPAVKCATKLRKAMTASAKSRLAKFSGRPRKNRKVKVAVKAATPALPGKVQQTEREM